MAKIVFVLGGVCSSLGKGIASASLALLLKQMGFRVAPMKVDPYLNVDPGTMSPERHGEVFVLDDGSETDLDLGHYERFIDQPLSKASSITMGQVYNKVLHGEREGVYLGRDIQIVPHITDVLKQSIYEAAKPHDILIVEIGGTIGDIEALAVLEAIRQIHHELPNGDAINIVLTLLPYLKSNNELKTKPTQMAIGALQRVGLFADIILARSDYPIPPEHLKKISAFCNVSRDSVFPAYTLDSIYEVPLEFNKYAIAEKVLEKLSLTPKHTPDLTDIQRIIDTITSDHTDKVNIGLIIKYHDLDDAYISVFEAIKAAAYRLNVWPSITVINSEKLAADDAEEWDKLHNMDGIVVPGGFGSRGIEGKIKAATYARTHNLPYLGLCLGSQILAIEFARNVANLEDAHSTEFDTNTPHPIVHILETQKSVFEKGGTMRKGSYPCTIKENTLAHRLYKQTLIHERHRHRFEFNTTYAEELAKLGLVVSGIYEEEGIPEIVELLDHPFMIGSQFHPEFLSRPTKPHPLFLGLVEASITSRKNTPSQTEV